MKGVWCRRLILFLILGGLILPAGGAAAQDQAPRFLLVHIEGTITAGTEQFLADVLMRGEEQAVDGVILRLDTPGGLVDATLGIMREINAAEYPVITYVGPSGAIAASAGSFILISGHVAAMAPGTTCGAAMPVTLQPGTGEAAPADDKTVQFLAGHLKSAARLRGRPEEIAARFVTENLTLTSAEALETGIADLEAVSVEQLLGALDGRQVVVGERQVVMRTEGAIVEEVDMTLRQQFAHWLSDPQIAFLLFLFGVYGILFGLNAPGTIVPEVGGTIALILALFGLGMFSASTLGIVLMAIAVLFFVAEACTPTFGVLTTAGAVSLVLGGFFLPVEPLLPAPWFSAFRMTVFGMAGVSVLFLMIVLAKLVQLRKRKAVYEQLGMKGYQGTVLTVLDPEGSVRIRGEIWRARTSDGHLVEAGRQVRVLDTEDMTLVVEEQTEPADTPGRGKKEDL